MSTEEWRPRSETVALIDAAREVLDEAAAGGYRFTLRNVYYALVGARRDPERPAVVQESVPRTGPGPLGWHVADGLL